ncbi:hypothetical protein [Tepidimicrobium xylanilyticum]|nr:hypothetical protein [Tepidimicrobium xylanilyticum]GMG95382.1 hypothetical protein EN5CB1_02080 [Tepidimicrobium xylanilyticum]
MDTKVKHLLEQFKGFKLLAGAGGLDSFLLYIYQSIMHLAM